MRNSTLIIALVVSVAANLALGGYLIGRLSAAGHQPPFAPMHGIVRWTSELDDERRDAIRPLLKEYARTLRPTSRNLRDAQQALRSALLADPLDEGALRAALGEFRATLAATQSAGEHAFVTLAAELTAAERAHLADSIRRQQRPRGPGRERH